MTDAKPLTVEELNQLRARDLYFSAATPDVEEFRQQRKRLLGTIDALRERLELNAYYVPDEGGGLRKEPWAGDIGPLDGISCRDETIKQQDKAIDDLRAQVEALTAERDAALAGAVQVKALVWEDKGYGFYKAPLPLIGSLRVEPLGADGFCCYWSVPGFSDSFVDGKFETAEAAMSAGEALFVRGLLGALEPSPQPARTAPGAVVLEGWVAVPMPITAEMNQAIRDAYRAMMDEHGDWHPTGLMDAALKAAPSAPVVPAGWVAVPTADNWANADPGCDMAEVLCNAARVCGGGALDIYRALLAAAPPAPLMTEAQVRADERIKALRAMASMIDAAADDIYEKTGNGDAHTGYLSGASMCRAEADRLERSAK